MRFPQAAGWSARRSWKARADNSGKETGTTVYRSGYSKRRFEHHEVQGPKIPEDGGILRHMHYLDMFIQGSNGAARQGDSLLLESRKK